MAARHADADAALRPKSVVWKPAGPLLRGTNILAALADPGCTMCLGSGIYEPDEYRDDLITVKPAAGVCPSCIPLFEDPDMGRIAYKVSPAGPAWPGELVVESVNYPHIAHSPWSSWPLPTAASIAGASVVIPEPSGSYEVHPLDGFDLHVDTADDGTVEVELTDPGRADGPVLTGTLAEVADKLRAAADKLHPVPGHSSPGLGDRVFAEAVDVVDKTWDALYDADVRLRGVAESMVQALSDRRLLLTEAEMDVLAAVAKKTQYLAHDMDIGLTAAVARWKAATT
jgi:hypothetical protein